MATAREIKRRIRSVKNVAQITRALQLVASSKMKRSQNRVEFARPYADELRTLLGRLSKVREDDEDVRGTKDVDDADLSLLEKHAQTKTIGIVLVTPDRGLAGSLTSNTLRYAEQFLARKLKELNVQHANVQFVAVGRRGRDYIARRKFSLHAEFTRLGDVPSGSDIRAIAHTLSDAYINGKVDVWYMIYPKYVNTMTQRAVDVQLLPIEPSAVETKETQAIDYIFEPSVSAIFAALLPRYLETLIYQPILETVASFYAAQFVAMKSATDNATDLADDLNLTYNKARQAAITNQILEVVAGANVE